MSRSDKPLVWLHGEIRTPPFSEAARIEVGYLLRLLQKGQALAMPHSRPLPIIGRAATSSGLVMSTRLEDRVPL